MRTHEMSKINKNGGIAECSRNPNIDHNPMTKAHLYSTNKCATWPHLPGTDKYRI